MKKQWEDSWEKVRPIGGEGQGKTILVQNKVSRELKILKSLKFQKSKKARLRLAREVQNLIALSKLDLNVPSVIEDNTELFDDKNTPLYIIMDYIEGDTLYKLINSNGPINFEDAIQYTLNIIHTVSEALSIGIVHRDLKPNNLIVKSEDEHEITIVDYGLSYYVDDEDNDLTGVDSTLDSKFLSLPETRSLDSYKDDPRIDITHMRVVILLHNRENTQNIS